MTFGITNHRDVHFWATDMHATECSVGGATRYVRGAIRNMQLKNCESGGCDTKPPTTPEVVDPRNPC